MLRQWLPVVAVAFLLAPCQLACGARHTPDEKKPLGVLPTAVTTAEPLWIPERILAGAPHEADARESRLAELRRLTSHGEAVAGAWHPDGRRVIYERRRDGGCGRLVELDLISGKERPLTSEDGWGSLGGVGQRAMVYAFARGVTACPAIGELTRRFPETHVHARGDDGEPRPLVTEGSYAGEPSLSPDGRMFVYTGVAADDPDLFLAATDDSSTATRIVDATGYDGGAVFSPDGSRIAWHGERPARDAAEGYAEKVKAGGVALSGLRVFVAGSQGQHPREVGNIGRFNLTPTFTPDSRKLVFASDYDEAESGDWDLYLIDPDGPVTTTGGPAVERITFARGRDAWPSFSVDGSYLLFVSSRSGGHDLYVARWQAD